LNVPVPPQSMLIEGVGFELTVDLLIPRDGDYCSIPLID